MDRLTQLEKQVRDLTVAHNALFKKVKELENIINSVPEDVEDESRVVLNPGEEYLSDEEIKKRQGF